MFGRLWHWVVEHIWLTIGIVVGVIILWKLWRGSGPSASSVAAQPGVDPTLVQAGLQQQAIQAQLQAQSSQAQTALQAQQDQSAMQVSLANIAAQLAQYQTTVGGQVASLQIQSQAQTQQQADTLAAAVAAQTLQTQAQIAAAQQATNQLIVTSQAQTTQQILQQQTTIAQINAGRDVSVAKANRRWCMLTDACCEVLRKPDDCFELTQLRKLRDEYVALLPDGPQQIEQYYDLAPRLIAGINAQDHARHLWERIHRLHIMPTARLVHAGNYAGAVQLYKEMLADLGRYLGPAPDKI